MAECRFNAAAREADIVLSKEMDDCLIFDPSEIKYWKLFIK